MQQLLHKNQSGECGLFSIRARNGSWLLYGEILWIYWIYPQCSQDTCYLKWHQAAVSLTHCSFYDNYLMFGNMMMVCTCFCCIPVDLFRFHVFLPQDTTWRCWCGTLPSCLPTTRRPEWWWEMCLIKRMWRRPWKARMLLSSSWAPGTTSVRLHSLKKGVIFINTLDFSMWFWICCPKVATSLWLYDFPNHVSLHNWPCWPYTRRTIVFNGVIM